MRILVTGATGYIGGRLVPRLRKNGWGVRCFARAAGRLRHHHRQPFREIPHHLETHRSAPDDLRGPELDRGDAGLPQDLADFVTWVFGRMATQIARRAEEGT